MDIMNTFRLIYRELIYFSGKSLASACMIPIALSSLVATDVRANEDSAVWEANTPETKRGGEFEERIESQNILEIEDKTTLGYQQGIHAFSQEILQKKIMESERDNQLISPLGISFLLSMIKHAVAPADQLEIERIIHLPQDEDELKVSASALIKKLMNHGLDIAGLLYLNHQYRLDSSYQDLVSQYYQSKVENGSSADEVNAWVQQVTNGQIQKLVDQADLNHFFVLLANAIHFKAGWAVPFKKRDTYSESFTTPKEMIQIPMMHKTDRVNYFENEDCQAIQLAYKDNPCSMLLILPKKDNDFSFIDDSTFNKILQGFASQMVKIALPGFELKQEVDVKQLLREMGMDQLFKKPDFSSLVDLTHAPSVSALPQLAITQMKQKSVLACDEKGTEASSVTSAIVGMTCVQPLMESHQEINFNRPFLAVLMTPEVPVLYGVIRDPSISLK